MGEPAPVPPAVHRFMCHSNDSACERVEKPLTRNARHHAPLRRAV